VKDVHNYNIIYTIYFKDGSQKAGEVSFESTSSQAELIPLEELFPYFDKIELEYKAQPDFQGMTSRVELAQN